MVHMFLAQTNVSAIGPLVGQGLAYTGFVSVLWPSVPLVVEEKVTGLAFGIVTSMQNLACAIIPLIAASIYSDSNDKYIPNVEYLFVSLACIGLIVGIYMNYYDYTHGHLLNSATPTSEYDQAIIAVREGGDGDSSMLNPLISDTDDLDLDGKRSLSNSGNSKLSDKEPVTYTFRADRQRSSELRRRSVDRNSTGERRSHSRGGSFSAYEEILRGGGMKTAGTMHKL